MEYTIVKIFILTFGSRNNKYEREYIPRDYLHRGELSTSSLSWKSLNSTKLSLESLSSKILWSRTHTIIGGCDANSKLTQLFWSFEQSRTISFEKITLQTNSNFQMMNCMGEWAACLCKWWVLLIGRFSLVITVSSNKSALPSGSVHVGVHLLWFENNINRGTEKWRALVKKLLLNHAA